ncbi:uncharacterized protein CLUP02_14844 [Colletotrichum lupini]|uniref:Uncharacterized protein n=1 Tax=Colletotrichum lupini TaxID=145971 RepID=A0A9Q8WNP2_9PEZI|nr:uncharacterized protein CLUP02_14844 [Colletotrichum lupini]UQC89315.1 hypothetical protein CLUP02_14844 [Colletotrichum lupini]
MPQEEINREVNDPFVYQHTVDYDDYGHVEYDYPLYGQRFSSLPKARAALNEAAHEAGFTVRIVQHKPSGRTAVTYCYTRSPRCDRKQQRLAELTHPNKRRKSSTSLQTAAGRSLPAFRASQLGSWSIGQSIGQSIEQAQLTCVPETGGRVAAAATLGGRISGGGGRISSPFLNCHVCPPLWSTSLMLNEIPMSRSKSAKPTNPRPPHCTYRMSHFLALPFLSLMLNQAASHKLTFEPFVDSRSATKLFMRVKCALGRRPARTAAHLPTTTRFINSDGVRSALSRSPVCSIHRSDTFSWRQQIANLVPPIRLGDRNPPNPPPSQGPELSTDYDSRGTTALTHHRHLTDLRRTARPASPQKPAKDIDFKVS